MRNMPVQDVINNYEILKNEKKLDSICLTELERLKYNEANNAKYSYGQYVSLIKEGRIN